MNFKIKLQNKTYDISEGRDRTLTIENKEL